MREFVSTNKMVLMNFSEQYCKSEAEILNSDCFADVWGKFIDNLIRIEKIDVLKLVNIMANPKKDFVDLFKLLLTFDLDQIRTMSPFYKLVLDHTDVLYELVENFYDYWRRLERYGVIHSRSNADGVENNSFIEATNNFNDLVLKTYRTISQKVLTKNFNIYRQLPAGVNASLMISKFPWMSKESKYANLRDVNLIEQIIIRPPFITYSAKNKRTGTYPEVFFNPVAGLDINKDEFYLYPAKVGSSLAYIYFHRDYLSHGITLCNLFDFVPKKECEGKKPDLIYLFGAPTTNESAFYYDKEEDIYVGIAPHGKNIDYFGYMKKMLLTLYNVKMINSGNLPLHGACVNITLSNGKNKTVVIIGDSGAGKSESLEALSRVAGDNISNMQTIFDDMGTFKFVNGEIIAYGTEIGAFVRLDDMTSGYAYKEMDRAIFMNPDKINSRLVIPVSTYSQIMKGYKVDMVLYANNYDNNGTDIKFFDNKEEALKVFVKGARNAKGTTSEEGLVESFFANPFGPVQKQSETTVLLDKYFQGLFDANIKVGEIYTRLAVLGYEQKGPEMVATKLFELLEE